MKTCLMIRETLEKYHVTQYELGLILGVSSKTISTMLNGKEITENEQVAISDYAIAYAAEREYDPEITNRLNLAYYQNRKRRWKK